MKKNSALLLLCSALFIAGIATAQTTVTYTLNPNDEDATVDDYVPSNNYPDGIDYTSRAWTINGTPVVWRSFFKFNLQCIPSNATITSAYLSLFWADTNSLSNSQHQSLTSSDESVLQRVTGPWTESSVTWNNQPAGTTTDQAVLPQSTSGTEDYLNIDVTAMVQQMISGSNNGFLLKLTNETYYAQMIFASGDNPHANKHPSLTITYTVPSMICLNLTLNEADEDANVDDYVPSNNDPYGIDYDSRAWTINGTPVVWRSFFKFNLQCIPSNATVTSAYLSLFWADTNSLSNTQHQSLTSSDESVLQRVNSSWSENTITWNNQPAGNATDQVIFPQSTSGTQDYLNMDVTAMVQQMTSGTNNGFLLKLTNETYYAQLIFASGDNPHSNKHPQLQVCYTVPTAVEENSGNHPQVSIYPSPSGGSFSISFGKNHTYFNKLKVTNALGEVILDENILFQNKINLDLTNQTKGIYFLQFINNRNLTLTSKVVVQ